MQPESLYRIAIREEGDYVVLFLAYYHSMIGAQTLGMMRKECLSNPAIREKWMVFVKALAADMIEDVTGQKVIDVNVETAVDEKTKN